MHTQHHPFQHVMEILRRKTPDFDDALYSLQIDAETVAVDQQGQARPYFTKLYLTSGDVKEFFDIKKNSQFMIKIFIFDSEEEKAKFLKENPERDKSN